MSEIDLPFLVENRAVAMFGRRAEADVDPEVQRAAKSTLDRADHAPRVIESQIAPRLRSRDVEQQEVTHSSLDVARDALERRVIAEARVLTEAGDWLRAGDGLGDE